MLIGQKCLNLKWVQKYYYLRGKKHKGVNSLVLNRVTKKRDQPIANLFFSVGLMFLEQVSQSNVKA